MGVRMNFVKYVIYIIRYWVSKKVFFYFIVVIIVTPTYRSQ